MMRKQRTTLVLVPTIVITSDETMFMVEFIWLQGCFGLCFMRSST